MPVRWLFMLCNNCNGKAQASRFWLVDSRNCRCIFL